MSMKSIFTQGALSGTAALALALGGCSAGEGFDPGDLDDDSVRELTEEQQLTAVFNAMLGSKAGDSEYAAVMPGLVEALCSEAHADQVYDFCAESLTASFATVTERGVDGTYGSNADPVVLDGDSDFCLDGASQSNDNQAGTQYKSWSLPGLLLSCDWGQDYNLSGSGVSIRPTEESLQLKGDFTLSGGPGSGAWACSLNTARGGDSDAEIDETLVSGSCTNDAGQTLTELGQLSSGGTCRLVVGDTGLAEPTAVCGDDAVGAALDLVSLDGSASSDPYGRPLRYAWRLIGFPDGSGAAINSITSAETTYQGDLAGEYLAELTVTTVDGTTDSCTQAFTAAVNENFRVELWWDNADDMDLHVLRPDSQGGHVAYTSPSDCGWFNMNPDWGVSGVDEDDPSLDLDDIWSTGPENINIEDPAVAPLDGWYPVYVHDYPYTARYYGDNGVHVRIYLNGSIVNTYDFTMSGENRRYYVAKIHWPSGQVVDCNGLAGCP